MIQMSYDKQSAGCRMSFVVADAAMSLPPSIDEFSGMRRFDSYGRVSAPATLENLKLLRQFLDNTIEELSR